jgi:hypothetical protein
MIYRSKKDPWLVALLSLLLLPFLLGILYLILPGIPSWTGWLLLFIGIAIDDCFISTHLGCLRRCGLVLASREGKQVHVHPTMAKALKIVAISFTKDVSKVSCCAS